MNATNDTQHTRELASLWMRGPLFPGAVKRRKFPLGPASLDEVITTNRLILILQGTMDYTVEGKTTRMKAGTQFLVPSWIRRVWSVPRGGPCEIIWCEFDDNGLESGWTECRRRSLSDAEFAVEKKGFADLLKLQTNKEGLERVWLLLRAEAELKSLLMRFLQEMEVPVKKKAATVRKGKAGEPFHPKVKQALKWLGTHFLEPDVLDSLYRESGMTRNYFRKLFFEAMQCSPHVHVERLRLRHARYLMHERDWPVKQVAAASGYRDPLYFSRIYHRFWGHPPGRDRKPGA